jgi:predicted phosphodiesterase
MLTAVLSDLHVGAVTKESVATHPRSLAILAERLAGVDHVVLLGDTLELREAPLGEVLAASEPLFRTLGEALGDGRVTIVPGNHDHHLAATIIDEHRLSANGALAVESTAAAPGHGPAARIAEWLRPAELRIAYPGLWLRPDVFATHGHYLDLHNTVPTLECLAASAIERALGGAAPAERAPDDYEAALGPLYALSFSLAQAGRRTRRLTGGASAAIWQRTGGSGGRPSLSGRLLAGAAIPAAVVAVNRAGLGPFRPDLRGVTLRTAGLAAMSAVAERLAPGAEHVLFGHTHRSGPWPGDDTTEWSLPGGGRLTNTGSWVMDDAFAPTGGGVNPYTPGTCVFLDEEGPPRLERLLPAGAATGT